MLKLFTTPQNVHGATFWICIVVSIVLFAAILAVLHPTSSAVKKRIIVVLAFLGGAFYLFEFMLPAKVPLGGGRAIANPLHPFLEPMGNVQQIWLALALILAVVNLFRVNGRL